MKLALRLITVAIITLLLGTIPVLGLDPSLDATQYGHTAWTAKDGMSIGAIFAMAQTPDGYLWLGSEFGLYRFDGVHAVLWQPPAGQHLPNKPYALLVTRDGTLWIGTFTGLVSWNGSKLTQYPDVGKRFITSLLEDHEGTVWVGAFKDKDVPAQVCAIRGDRVQCDGENGEFGTFVWSLGEDNSGTLWAGAESGVWRLTPGTPKHYAIAGKRVGDLVKSGDGRLLIGISGAGLQRIVGDTLQRFPVHTSNGSALIPDPEVNSNKLLRDHDGGLWIGTRDRGLLHIHNGRADVFTKSDGLSGNTACSLFEDREGNVWFASTRGLDRFRELPVRAITAKQGLSSNSSTSLVAGADGSIWIGSREGLTRWKSGQTTVFRKATGLPAESVQSMFADKRGRLWVAFPGHRVAYYEQGRFFTISRVPSEEVYSIAGDDDDNLWLSGNKGLTHIHSGALVETLPWSAMGRHQQAKVIVPDEGGLWLAFWEDGGVLYFKDGKIRASYTVANGLGKGPVSSIQFDHDGALWASTQEGGLSRIKDGRVTTLTSKSGLPCDIIHWSTEDQDHSLWVYTSCGLLRISRTELDAWIADPDRRIETELWDAVDGVGITAASPGYFNPPLAKAADGKLWFLGSEGGVALFDPHHLAINKVPPPVHVDRIVADGKTYWESLPGTSIGKLHLPARLRDVAIDYSALSLAAPEKVHFKYKLEGQDGDWREVVNDRKVQYSNLRAGSYRFHVIAANNSGVWNAQGDTLEFSVDPAYYQTGWFRALCAAGFLALLWAAYQLRIRQVQREFNVTVEARVSERTRIARELHDTLLQSLQALLFQYQAARNLFAAGSERGMQVLDATIDRTEQAIAEGRDAIRGIRSDTVTQNALPELLTMAGSELAESQGDHPLPSFAVTVEGERRTLLPAIREESYRVALELLRNAFRHAGAHRIEAEVRYDRDMLRLRIRDDGKGIDLKILQQGSGGHWGLRGVRERSERIGAKLDVWTEAGAGTEFELTVPARIAYAGSSESLPFRLLRKVRGYAYRD